MLFVHYNFCDRKLCFIIKWKIRFGVNNDYLDKQKHKRLAVMQDKQPVNSRSIFSLKDLQPVSWGFWIFLCYLKKFPSFGSRTLRWFQEKVYNFFVFWEGKNIRKNIVWYRK